LQALLKKYPQLQEVVDKVTASKETGGVVEYFHALREGGKAMARKRQEKNSKIKPNAIKFAK